MKIVKPFTSRQIEAVDAVVKSINDAKKAGVVFYGQCDRCFGIYADAYCGMCNRVDN